MTLTRISENTDARNLLGPLLTVGVIFLLELTDFDHVCPPAIVLVLAVLIAAYSGGLLSGLVSALLAIVYQYFYFTGARQGWLLTEQHVPEFAFGAIATLAAAVFAGPIQRHIARALQLETDVAGLQGQLKERRLAEGALRQSEERYQRMVQHLPVAMLAVERNRGKGGSGYQRRVY